MSAVATCPQCRLQLSVPSEADALSVVKCPVCRSQFELQSVTIAPVLEMIVIPPPTEEDEASATSSESPAFGDVSQEPELALADESADEVADESDETAAFDLPSSQSSEDEPIDEGPLAYDSADGDSVDDISPEDTPLSEEPTGWDARPATDPVPDDSVPNRPVNESLRETIELTDELTDEMGGGELNVEPEPEIEQSPPTSASMPGIPTPESPVFSARETLENLSIGTTVANFAAQPKDLQMWSGIADQDDANQDDAEAENAIDELPATETSLLPEEVAPETTPPENFTVDSTMDEISIESSCETESIESPKAEESDFGFDAGTAALDSSEATVGYEAPLPEPTEWIKPETEPSNEEIGADDISTDIATDIATMPTATDYEPIEEPAGQPWMDVAERPAYDDSVVDSRPKGTEGFEVDDIGSPREIESLREDEIPRASSTNHFRAPIPGVGMSHHSTDPASRSLQKLLGMACAGTLGVGLLGLGGWAAFERFTSGNREQASSVAQATQAPLARAGDSGESGLQQASYEAEIPSGEVDQNNRTDLSNVSEPAPIDPGRYGNGEAAPSNAPQPQVANAPSYSMDQLAMALEQVQKRERSFASARLDDPNTRGTLANAYIAYCDLAEALTYVQDEPNRADRMMILLNSKDVFRVAVWDKKKRLDVSRLAKFWAEKSDRPHNGIFITGQLTSVHRQGSVQEYQMESDMGEPWVFVMPKRIDRRIFSVGVNLVVAGSLVTDPAQRIPGYAGNAQTVIWASSVKALDRSNGAHKSPAMDPLTALPTR